MSDDTKPDIWMPWYVGDYLKKTSRLSTIQHGAYCLLLMDYWQNGPLPLDDEQLAAVTRLSIEEWTRVRLALMQEPYFYIQDGAWHNRKSDKLLAAAAHKIAQKSAAGRASAKAKRDHRDNGKPTSVATSVERPLKRTNQRANRRAYQHPEGEGEGCIQGKTVCSEALLGEVPAE